MRCFGAPGNLGDLCLPDGKSTIGISTTKHNWLLEGVSVTDDALVLR